MKEIQFEWDNDKATSNLRKHKVSFEEAKEVFSDPLARIIDDPDHSNEEDRFIILGASSRQRVLIVCHCYRLNDEIIRIISARRATKNEQRYYKG